MENLPNYDSWKLASPEDYRDPLPVCCECGEERADLIDAETPCESCTIKNHSCDWCDRIDYRDEIALMRTPSGDLFCEDCQLLAELLDQTGSRKAIAAWAERHGYEVQPDLFDDRSYVAAAGDQPFHDRIVAVICGNAESCVQIDQ